MFDDFNTGDVVYLHPPENPIQDRYISDDYYYKIGVIIGDDNYYRVQVTEQEENCPLYHSGEMTKIGEL